MWQMLDPPWCDHTRPIFPGLCFWAGLNLTDLGWSSDGLRVADMTAVAVAAGKLGVAVSFHLYQQWQHVMGPVSGHIRHKKQLQYLHTLS